MAKSKAQRGRKTVRFTELVKRAGEPHAHTLWVAPKDDAELQRAIAAERVLTVKRGASTDAGLVGFDVSGKEPAQILIFPKSLKAFSGARVVGIKFDLVEQPKFASATQLKRPGVEHGRRHRKAAPQPLPKASAAT